MPLPSEEVFVLKIRVKFAKRGSLKYVGHLDVLRYFQKLIRRAGIDIAYSEGFNPHQKLSFAQPLGVGMLSEGEYLDMEVNTTLSSAEAVKTMNEASVDDIEILSYRALKEGSKNAMASVAAADYLIEFREGYAPDNFDFYARFKEFLDSSESITVCKETEKSQKTIDLKEHIHGFSGDDKKLNICLSCGSVINIKPDFVMEEFFKFNGLELSKFTFIYTRMEVYGEEDGKFIPLMDFGEEIF